MKISTLPSVWSQISGPVVALCAAGLAGLSNWPRITEPGVFAWSSSAFAIAPFIPFAPSVRTSSAPYAFNNVRRSMLMVSGRVSTAWYPFAVATAARPIPVLPDVGSIIVAPGFKMPFFSASSIIARLIRSLTDPVRFRYSNFVRIVASVTPAASLYLLAFKIGVPPISSTALSLIFAIIMSSFIL